MKEVNIEEFLKKDEELRKQTAEMQDAIFDEMEYIIQCEGGEVLFDAVDDPTSNDLVKGFRLKEGKLQYLSEWKGEKPMLALHNPYGHWYDVQRGYGFKTIRYLASYLQILRNAVKWDLIL